MIKKVIFVDEDNTGLSPFAATLFRKKALEGSLKITAESRGTIVLFPEPVNRKLSEAAVGFGTALEDHQAAALEEKDFTADALILTMDSATKKRVLDTGSGFSNVFTLKEYVEETGDVRLPLGESTDKYVIVCETVERLVEHLIEKLRDEEIIE